MNLLYPTVKLGRVARLVSGVGFPHEFQGRESGDRPFLKVSDLSRFGKDGYSIVGARNWVSHEDLRVLGARLAPRGSVVFPKVGAALLKNPRRLLSRPAAMDNNLMAVVPQVGDPRFLLYSLSLVDLGEFSGSGPLPFVNEGQIRELRISFPASGEQRRIADFLDAETARIDQLLQLQVQQISLLTAHRLSKLSEMRNGLIKQFGSIRLRHLLMGVEQGWSPQCEDRITENGGWGVIKAGCVNTGEFDELQHKALPQGVEPRLEYLLKPGDLLMSRASGSPELIGSTGIVRDIRANLLLCDKVYRLTVDHTKVTAEYVAYMLRSHAVREHIKNGISGAEGMANNLPIPIVKDCILPDAPLDKQSGVVAEARQDAEATARARSALQRSTSLLAERRQALITAAVTGQFDVSTASGRGIED